ncbi:MAG: amidase [Granulosicoccus sp.]|nr:amidase [Granulosicoccus sp.]
MNAHPPDLPIGEARAALRSGALSALALTEAHLERIDNRNPVIGAFVHIATESALSTARATDIAITNHALLGPLHGIPFAIKDIFDVTGWPVSWGSRLQQHRIARKTAPAVQSLIDAGAIPLGLVATYELASVGPDRQSLYPQPRNPWNHEHITGGSSSGSAAAVAAGMVRLALGTDTGGSIRSPAAYCGVVGLKPSFGVLPTGGVMPLAPSLDHVGLISPTVPEAAVAFSALANRPPSSPAAVRGIRVAYGRNWCYDNAAHAGLQQLMDDAAAILTLCAMNLSVLHLPDYAAIERTAAHIIHAEQYAVHGASVLANADAVGSMAAQSILSGARDGPEQLAAERKVALDFSAVIDAVLSDHEVLVLPTTLTPAPPFSDFAHGRAVWTAMRTIPFNLSGHPALSVPMGFVDGLPLGLQIVGRHGDEASVLRVGEAFEAATDHAAMSPYFT